MGFLLRDAKDSRKKLPGSFFVLVPWRIIFGCVCRSSWFSHAAKPEANKSELIIGPGCDVTLINQLVSAKMKTKPLGS